MMNDGHSNLEIIRLSNRGADDSQRRIEILRESAEISHADLCLFAGRWETRFGKLGMPIYYGTGQEKAGYVLGVAVEVRERGKGRDGSIDRYNAITARVEWEKAAFDKIRAGEYRFLDCRLGEVDDQLEIVSCTLTNRTATAMNPIEIALGDDRGQYRRYANELGTFTGQRFYRELITLIGRDRAEEEQCTESRARRLALSEDMDLQLALGGGDLPVVLEAAARVRRKVQPTLTLREAYTLAGEVAPSSLQLMAVELGCFR